MSLTYSSWSCSPAELHYASVNGSKLCIIDDVTKFYIQKLTTQFDPLRHSIVKIPRNLTYTPNIHKGQSKVINGVKITVNEGSIEPSVSWEPRLGHMWRGKCTENDFQISTENGETITNIEITTEEESKWSIRDLCGTGWTTITKGAAWTGSSTSVNVGGEFEQVIKLTVTVDETTAIKNVETTSSQKTGKFIKDGKLVIVKDGKQYNANGQKM